MIIIYFVFRFLSCHKEVFCICDDDIVTTVGWRSQNGDNLTNDSTSGIIDWLVFAHEEGSYAGCDPPNNVVFGIDVPPCPMIGHHCLGD